MLPTSVVRILSGLRMCFMAPRKNLAGIIRALAVTDMTETVVSDPADTALALLVEGSIV